MCVCERAAARTRARRCGTSPPTLFSQWDSHNFFFGNGVCLLRSKDFHSGTVLFLFRASRNYKILLIYTAASPDAAPQSYLLCGPHLPEEKKKKKTDKQTNLLGKRHRCVALCCGYSFPRPSSKIKSGEKYGENMYGKAQNAAHRFAICQMCHPKV